MDKSSFRMIRIDSGADSQIILPLECAFLLLLNFRLVFEQTHSKVVFINGVSLHGNTHLEYRVEYRCIHSGRICMNGFQIWLGLA